jgi:hypothetical protein
MRLNANTFGSSYDTTLSVYTGSRGNLNQIVCNDDAIGLQSRVSFDAIAGTTYYFSPGSFGGQVGGQLKFTVDLGVQIYLSINDTGSVTKTGLTTISGILKCSKPVSGGFLSIDLLQQKSIRSNSIAQGSNSISIDCISKTPWSMTFASTTSTIFGDGRANATANISFPDSSSAEAVQKSVINTISLTGKKR